MDTSRGTGTAVVLPSELASMAPGPELAAVLASIDRSALSADAMLDLIAARARLLWHIQGELLADQAQAVAATVAAEPLQPDEDEEQVTDAVGELVGWTVHWTTSYAQGQADLAVALRQRLPMVLSALQAGQIDQAKAAAFVEALACVNDEVAVRIATRLLPKARTWTLKELRASLRYHVAKADPGAARRRYARRVATRDVTLRAQPDGTANLSAQGLAPHRAAAAYDRMDRIARAARASGDLRTLAQLRADALCDVLAGIPFQLSPSTDPITAVFVLAAPLLAARPSQLRGSTAQADASAERDLPSSWSVPAWRTESRFANRKTTDPDPARAGTGGDGRDPRGAFSSDVVPPESDVVPPEEEPVGVLDLYDYDRACLTDEDRAWATIGCEPPGASEDETPDWWHLCRLARDHSHRSPSQPLTPATAQARTEESRSENGNPRREPSGSGQPAEAQAEESCFENGNPRRDPAGHGYPRPRQPEDSRRSPDPSESGNRPESARPRWWSDPEDVMWALAQADALHDRAILSPDVLAGDRCACGGRLSVRPGVVDVQIKLTTLAGLDEHPALIPGLGVTLAPLARHIAFDPVTRPTWRWSVFDDHGELLHHDVTRQRPTGPESRSETAKIDPGDERSVRPCTCTRFEPGHRRGSIELQLTLATLHELIADPTRVPGWRAVLTDIADQIDRDGHPLRQTGRMPDAVEEAFIRARDRSCRAPHCHVPASRCELDHRLEYAKGGPSHRDNVDCRCKRHHHLRERGYQITKTGTTTTWTVPNGRTYTVTTDKDLILTRED